MATRMTISAGNLSGLVANLLAADATAQRIVRQTVYTYGNKTFRLARELCPVSKVAVRRGEHEHKPGFLRSRIRLGFSDDGLAFRVGWRAKDFTEQGEPEYFRFTERGTRFMAARPCVTPARDTTVPEFRRALGANVRGAIRRRRRAV